jgi:hypothetical protein
MNSLEKDQLDKNSDKFILIVDPSLIGKEFFPDTPSNWYSRILYVGFEGANAWQNVSLDPLYNQQPYRDQEINIVSSFLDKIRFNTFISLGPGDGLFDQELFKFLGRSHQHIAYIPVDISDGLLCLTMAKMSPVSKVPFGILADFEDRFDFIMNEVNNFDGKPRLFSMLGNTLGNIDIDITSFIDNLSKSMRIGDYLILNISIISDNWTHSQDPRMQYDQYTEAIRIFLSRGISRRTREPLSSLVDNFHDIVGFRYRHNANQVTSEFSEYIEIYDKRNSSLLTKVGRFRLSKFIQWINSNKQLHVELTGQMMDDGSVGDGYLLIKRI